MKMIFIILAIFCCMVNARVLTYTKTINKVKCTIRVNPEKGRVEVGKCSVDSIGFFDQDGMLVAVFNEDKLEAEHSYARLEFFETKIILTPSYVKKNNLWNDILEKNSGNYNKARKEYRTIISKYHEQTSPEKEKIIKLYQEILENE